MAIDWQQPEGDFHLLAKSRNGCVYRGNYGPGLLDATCSVELALFRAKTGAIVLMGPWTDSVSGAAGLMVFRLFPDKPRVAKKKK